MRVRAGRSGDHTGRIAVDDDGARTEQSHTVWHARRLSQLHFECGGSKEVEASDLVLTRSLIGLRGLGGVR
jgi:hypothetical protein